MLTNENTSTGAGPAKRLVHEAVSEAFGVLLKTIDPVRLRNLLRELATDEVSRVTEGSRPVAAITAGIHFAESCLA